MMRTMNLLCVAKTQFLDDCNDPNCETKHTKGTIYEVTFASPEKTTTHKNGMTLTLSEEEALLYEVGKLYPVNIPGVMVVEEAKNG